MDSRIRAHSEVLVKYSMEIKKGDMLVIVAETGASPLVREVYRSAIEAGANVQVQMVPAGLDEIYYTHASTKQLGWVSPAAITQAKDADAFLNIYSQDNTRALTNIDPQKQAIARKAKKKLRNYILSKRWCITLHPTNAYAQDANMSLSDFEDFVYGTVFANRKNPIKCWKDISRRQARMVKKLEGAEQIHILAPETDLKFSVEGRNFINSDGRRNMPSGEVFTSPVAASVEGHVRFSFPICFQGHEVEDVRLVFRKGKVIEASAVRGQGLLNRMLNIDAGARRLGELGIGTNFGITSFIKNILFDEKIGGTVHLALGNSFKQAGGKNISALHWDMILDLRRDGILKVDGKALLKNGKFSKTYS